MPDWNRVKFVGAFRDASYGVASLFVLLATDDVSADSLSGTGNSLIPPRTGSDQAGARALARDVNLPPHVTGKYDFTVSQGAPS